MAEFITPAISAGQLVTVTSNVLPAGGNALNLIETMLTQNWRVPIGSVYQFASPDKGRKQSKLCTVRLRQLQQAVDGCAFVAIRHAYADGGELQGMGLGFVVSLPLKELVHSTEDLFRER